MGNPLKSIFQICNSKISSRSRGSWPAALATPVGIGDELWISEIFKEFYRWTLPTAYLNGGEAGRGWNSLLSQVFSFFFLTLGVSHENRHDAKRPQAYKMKMPVMIFILNAWTATNMKRFWTWHFHGSGVYFPFMCVSTMSNNAQKWAL